MLVAQSCPTLCDPIDCSLPGSFVHGISQARIPEWVAIPFSRALSQPRDQTLVSHVAGIAADSLWTEPPGKHLQQISVIYITEWIILRSFPSHYEQRAVNCPSRRTEPENLRLTPDSASSTLSETLSSLSLGCFACKVNVKKALSWGWGPVEWYCGNKHTDGNWILFYKSSQRFEN